MESLAATARKPDPLQLTADIAFVTKQNPLVRKLIKIRSNVLAHRNVKITLKAQDVWKEQQLTFGEIETLLQTGFEILNRYSVLFKASSFSGQIWGHDDYKIVLEYVRREIQRMEAEFEKQLKQTRQEDKAKSGP